MIAVLKKALAAFGAHDVLAAAGLASLGYGVAQYSAPAAFIVCGAVVLLVALIGARTQ